MPASTYFPKPPLIEGFEMCKPSAEMIELLFGLRRKIETAAHGEVGQMIQSFTDLHGMSRPTLWRWLEKYAGFKSERKQRMDAGKTKLPEETLLFIATSKKLSVRANGKVTKPTSVAMNIADANGLEVNVGAGTINRLLRQRNLDTKSQANARNHLQMRSLFPNHVHQIDPSLCLIYYMGGRQMVMTEQEFNKNKPTAIEKVKLKVWRYVRYDHASGSLDVRYYEAAGENQQSLFDFLLYTWSPQPHRLSHGRPDELEWDKGSANTSKGIVKLLDALGIEHRVHATHHAWVKGGVENGNRIVEMHFESRLRDQPVNSIAELNASAELWVRDYNANAIKFVDSRIQRASGEKLVRDELWQMILKTPEKLIAMPDRKTCSWFLTGDEEERTVKDSLISYVHPEIKKSRQYDLSDWANYYSQKDKVKVMPILLAEGAIRVEIAQFGKEPLLIEVKPQADFDDFGRSKTAWVKGEEYRTAPYTVAQQAAKEIAQTAYGTKDLDEAEKLLRKNVKPFQQFNDGNGVVAHTHLGQGELPTRLLPAAKDLETAAISTASKTVEHARDFKTKTAMAQWLYNKVGANNWKPAMAEGLEKRFPDGASEQELEQVLTDLKAGRTAAGKAKLYAVG